MSFSANKGFQNCDWKGAFRYLSALRSGEQWAVDLHDRRHNNPDYGPDGTAGDCEHLPTKPTVKGYEIGGRYF